MVCTLIFQLHRLGLATHSLTVMATGVTDPLQSWKPPQHRQWRMMHERKRFCIHLLRRKYPCPASVYMQALPRPPGAFRNRLVLFKSPLLGPELDSQTHSHYFTTFYDFSGFILTTVFKQISFTRSPP